MERNKKIIKTSIIGIIVNILLVIFKAIVGILANSIAIVLDSINNLTDTVSAIVTLVGTKMASKKPDKQHPYGHGRIEYIASIIISEIILLVGIGSLKESFEKIIKPQEAQYTMASFVIISVAIVVKLLLSKYVKRIGKSVNSQSLIATATDALMDAIVSSSTLVAAFISIIWHISLEGYIGLMISIIIIKSSIEILKDSLSILIGDRVDPELTEKIKTKINKFKEVEGVYDLILHSYGPSTILGSVHIQVDDNMSAKEIDKLSRAIQTDVYSQFGVSLTVGVYAANTSEGEFVKIKKELLKIIKNYSEITQLHGFYVDTETNHISFDLIMDYKCNNMDQIKDSIIEKIKEKYPNYTYETIIDFDYSE